MNKDTLRAAWAEIDLGKLDGNIKNIKGRLQEAALSRKRKDIAPAGSPTNIHDSDQEIDIPEIIGVIKADAYGHGAVKCAEVLRANGVKTFAVATLDEAIELREADVTEDIIMLGLTPDMYAETLVEYDITPVVCNSENAAAINGAAAKAGKKLKIFIAVDTGMGRIGYVTADPDVGSEGGNVLDDVGNVEKIENAVYSNDVSVEDVRKIASLDNLEILGLFSHMATADAFDKSFSRVQEGRFNKFYDDLIAAGVDIPRKALANSASIMEIPSVHFDYVRPGIILYGCYPSNEVDRSLLKLEQVMSVKGNIVQLKDVPVGFSCGYGRKFIAERPSKIATIPMGYADGYPRPYSPVAKVIVNGVVCPVAGNICMDQFMVDVTDVPDVKEGDQVIVMGSDGVNTISAEDIAEATGTISYEICCAFGQRLPRVYIE